MKILAFHLGRGGNKDVGRHASAASRRGATRQKREKEKAAVAAPSFSWEGHFQSAFGRPTEQRHRWPAECTPVPQGSLQELAWIQ